QMAIAASAALLLGALAFLAWAMTTRATAELDQLAAQLETLEAASLDRRLAQGGTSEVDRLVAVLNRLLSRLETAVGHLRRFAARSDDGTATIEVDDDGPGIPATDLPQVFERFRRGRGATAGTGLGLALCQEIATRHHGRIALESAPGAGTRVTVTLPLADAGG